MRRRRTALALTATTSVVAAALLVPATAASAADEQRTVTVHLDQTVQEDYLGVGVNVIPWSLLEGTTKYGYDDADWEVDVERIHTLQPKVARIWFQIDWMELEKGQYDFESPEMKAFYRYLDAFKDAGTEIELNFGWKVGARVHDWFTIPGAPDPYISAPADLPAYGASASALLQNLFDRGYDNVDHLTFYNEPNGSWDFWAPGDEKAYYADMARAVSDRLTADGLRDEIDIWGPEEVNAVGWTQYMAENAGDVFDQYSFHLYGESYDAMGDAIAQRRAVIDDAPLNLSEMGWTNPGTSVWETGYANYIIRSANDGVHSNLIWQLNGVMTGDPAGDTNGSYNLWDSLILGLEPTAAFSEAGPLMRYVPTHSTVLGTEVSDADVRATAFRAPDGELTVLVETQSGSPKDVRVQFEGGATTADFTRIAYTDSIAQPGENALLPASSGSLTPDADAFTDTEIGDEHTYAIYTTAPAATQVEMTPVRTAVAGGGQVQLGANVIDGTGTPTWSVVGTDNGSIDANGVFTAPSVTTERTVAVRATLPDGEYGVAQVEVTPASTPGVTDAPVFSLERGVYDSIEAVTITSATPDAQIFYTTDGSEPTASSTPYTGQIFLEPLKTTYVRAVAVAPGADASGVTSRLYKVKDVQNAPDGYTFCQYADGGACAFEGEANVAFASDGQFVFGTFTDGVDCAVASFGSDPNPGGDNRCFVNPDVSEEPPLVSILNAGFERPATGGTANGPMVNGWTFSARAGIQHNNSVFVPASPAPQGERTAYLKSDSGLASRIDQTVVFPAGEYAITFAAANRVGFGGQQEFDVQVDGQTLGHYVPVGGDYQYYETAPFTVTQGEHTISFVATTTEGDNTGFVDDVRVVAAETEPGDTTAPTVTVKEGAAFTQGTAEAYDKVSFKLFDEGKIDRAVINGVVKDLVDNTWSDVNFVAPGVFGAVSGENTLVVSDVAGNSTTVTFTLR